MSEIAGVIAAAAEVEAFCRRQGWGFCFIGGIAVQRWGMPRFTQDVDLTLFTGLGGEEPVVDRLLAEYTGRLRQTRQFALERRVLLARLKSGVDLDVALGALPFEEASVSRATVWTVNPAVSLTTCSAEDLVVHKVFAGRDRDWGDVEGVVTRQFGKLKVPQIRRDLIPLLEMKDDPTSLQKFDDLLRTVERRTT